MACWVSKATEATDAKGEGDGGMGATIDLSLQLLIPTGLTLL